jgi:hypothetical protein
MSAWCKDLITRLLENDPQKRLHEAVKVKAHPFFLGQDVRMVFVFVFVLMKNTLFLQPDFWLTLSSFDPPYVPERTSAEDTSAFDERKEFFPILEEKPDDDSSSDSSSDNDTPEMPRKDVQQNFWHVSLHNLGLLNKKKENGAVKEK